MAFTLSTVQNKKQPFAHSAIHLRANNYRICCSGEMQPGDNPASGNEENSEHLPDSACAFCKTDFGGAPLEKLSVYPICETCKTELDKKIFPLWVKLFFAGVMLLVIFSIFFNGRFYAAYMNVKQANAAYTEKNVAKAAYLMTKASNEVPEAADLALLANFFTGIDLLTRDKSTEALVAFDKCQGLPAAFHLNELVLQAEMGSGYDKKDYKLFLTSSKAFLQLDTTQSMSWGGVASAYACLYAQSGADSLKQQSLKYFNRAKALNDTGAEAKEFYGRILYRLDSRQIISKDQFDKKFPNGYTPINLK
jgi:hypothetical protein